MNIKKLIKESVVSDTIKTTRLELKSILKQLKEQLIIEGVDDPGILKCVFVVGGSGSGKSHVAADLFGIDQKTKASFSSFGLKTVNSDSAFEHLLVKNGINPKDLANIEKNNPELWKQITEVPGGIRDRAKQISVKQKAFYEEGRLGMIIDGTGDDAQKVKKQKEHAESLGYDCYMVYVDTKLEVALERNRKRKRVLPDQTVQEIWKDAQANKSTFASLFSGRIIMVDNSEYGPIKSEIHKAVNQFIARPLQNSIGKQWMETARKLKQAKMIN